MNVSQFMNCCGAVIIYDFPKAVDEKTKKSVRDYSQMIIKGNPTRQIYAIVAKATSKSNVLSLHSSVWPYYDQLGFGEVLLELGFQKTGSWVNNPGHSGEALNESYLWTPNNCG